VCEVSVFIGAHLIPLCCYLEVEHIAIDLDDIYLGVTITNPVTSYCIRTKVITEGLIITTLRSKVIQTLIIVDPQSNIPGLIIRPTIILSVENVGLISDCHLRKIRVVWSLYYRDTLHVPLCNSIRLE